MLKIVLATALYFFCQLAVADEIDYIELTKKLDSDEFIVRDNARLALIKAGFPAIKHLKHIQKTERISLEVETAIISIIDKYYYNAQLDIVSIWSLPKQYRFVQDKDVASECYDKAKKLLAKLKPNNSYVDGYKGYDDLELAGTYLFFLDALDKGIDIEPIRNEMSELAFVKKISYWMYESGDNIDLYKPPPPIEDIIADLKKNDVRITFYLW